MTTQKEHFQHVLIAGYVFITIGGWLLHLSIHPPMAASRNYLPFLAGLISATVIALGFMFKKTLAYAYVVNGMLIIIGTITMAHFSLLNLPSPFTWKNIFVGTLLPDIIMSWTAFALGKALFELGLMKNPDEPHRQGRFFRYPNMGWWWIHAVALSVVYTLGHQLWK